jgi:hypothetical protein
MARFGKPMYAPAQDCFVFVTIERDGSYVGIKRWRGRSFVSVKRAARACYPGATLGFGSPCWVTR